MYSGAKGRDRPLYKVTCRNEAEVDVARRLKPRQVRAVYVVARTDLEPQAHRGFDAAVHPVAR
jgi:uncharacterized protein related to proFAR isomerase